MDPVQPSDPHQPAPYGAAPRHLSGDAAPRDAARDEGAEWAPPVWTAYDGSQQYLPPAGAGRVPPEWAAPPIAPVRRRRRGARVAAAGVAAAVLVGGGVGIGAAVTAGGTSGSTSAATTNPDATNRQTVPFPGFPDGSGGSGSSGSGSGSSGSGSSGSGAAGAGTAGSQTSAASDTQATGVVVIDTVLGYQNAEAAGTGMVISADGTVLTNNHVVEGATSIKATVVSTGRTYTATVVGTDKTDDVAVIRLTGASGLDTVSTATTSNIAAGAAVVAVGNAGGTGSLTAATGTVTATGQSITATDESGANAERLTGLLEIDAAIQSGDSGGPLYNASGQVVGIDTAAQTSQGGTTEAGYAIPIGSALTIARQIENGTGSTTITIGLPAFLGVSLAPTGGASATGAGATIAGVVAGLPAADAGLVAGDTITAIGDTPITSTDDLSTAMASLSPGQSVPISWTTATGATNSATVTLVAGPAA